MSSSKPRILSPKPYFLIPEPSIPVGDKAVDENQQAEDEKMELVLQAVLTLSREVPTPNSDPKLYTLNPRS